MTPNSECVAKIIKQYKAGDPLYGLDIGSHQDNQRQVFPHNAAWSRNCAQLRPCYYYAEDYEPSNDTDNVFELPTDHPLVVLKEVAHSQ